jgi:hypothetical protein
VKALIFDFDGLTPRRFVHEMRPAFADAPHAPARLIDMEA